MTWEEEQIQPAEDDDGSTTPPLEASEPEVAPTSSKAKNPPPENIESFTDALDYAEPRPPADGDAGDKRTYSTRLSNALALLVADKLRADFPGILPTQDGKGNRIARARRPGGYKKLDVNYSTLQTGLGLGVSIKTINYRDPTTLRYTKNYSRNDNELRAEASDYHRRQPFSVLAALLFVPADAAEDAGKGKPGAVDAGVSSFGACVRYFRTRGGRHEVDEDPERFERFFVCLYWHDGNERGKVRCFDVANAPPKARFPTDQETLSLEDAVAEIRATYDLRNTGPAFEWAD